MTRPAKPRSPARKPVRGKSLYEELFAEQLAGEVRKGRLPQFEREVRFAPPRRWRWDFSWPDHGLPGRWTTDNRFIGGRGRRLAVEIHGGLWIAGRHNRPLGMERDFEKFIEGQLLGWLVLPVTTGQVANGEALKLVLRAFGLENHARRAR